MNVRYQYRRVASYPMIENTQVRNQRSIKGSPCAERSNYTRPRSQHSYSWTISYNANPTHDAFKRRQPQTPRLSGFSRTSYYTWHDGRLFNAPDMSLYRASSSPCALLPPEAARVARRGRAHRPSLRLVMTVQLCGRHVLESETVAHSGARLAR